jgi:hypothetical protein
MRAPIVKGALCVGASLSLLAGSAEAHAAARAHTRAVALRGTVVHRVFRAHSFVIAARGGRLVAVHALRSPRLGTRVSLRAVRLRDGTYRVAGRERRLGRATRVRVSGRVSFVNARMREFVLSAPGVSMLVQMRHSAARLADALPTLGSEVSAVGTLDDQGQLDGDSYQTVAVPSGTWTVDLEGVVLAVDPSSSTITVSADDDDQSGAVITVSVPSTFNIADYSVGEEVELLVEPTGTDTATLLGSADDQNSQSAGDAQDEQGQNPGDQGDQQADDQGDQQVDDQGDQGDQQAGDEGDQGDQVDQQAGSSADAGSASTDSGS